VTKKKLRNDVKYDNDKKITQFVEYFTKNKLDIVMMTKTNSK